MYLKERGRERKRMKEREETRSKRENSHMENVLHVAVVQSRVCVCP